MKTFPAAVMIALALVTMGAAPSTPTTRPALTPESEAKIRKLYAEGEKVRVAAVAAIQKKINATPKPKGEELAKLQAQLKEFEARKGAYMPQMQMPPELGRMGTLPGEFIVLSVQGAEDMVVKWASGDRVLWLHGVPTAGKADGTRFESADSFEVAGTHPYTTIRGQTTIFQISPLPPLPAK